MVVFVCVGESGGGDGDGDDGLDCELKVMADGSFPSGSELGPCRGRQTFRRRAETLRCQVGKALQHPYSFPGGGAEESPSCLICQSEEMTAQQ